MSFTDVMKQRSDAELLEITTTRRDDYQPEAVLAAEEELRSRVIDPEHLTIAKAEVETRLEQRRQKETQQKELEVSLFDPALWLNPFKAKTALQQVRLLTAWLAALCVLYAIFYAPYLRNSFPVEDFDTLLYLVIIGLFPVAVVLFNRRRQAGWIFVVAMLVYSGLNWLMQSRYELAVAFNRYSMFDSGEYEPEWWDQEIDGEFDAPDEPLVQNYHFFYTALKDIFMALFAGLLIWLLTRRQITEWLSISRMQLVWTLVLPAVVNVLLLLVVYLS